MHYKRKILTSIFILIISLNLVGQNQFGHVIPENKGLSEEWKNSLLEKGEQKVYRGEELKTIGMPVGGIAAGQLYVRGDGSLACWWIANNAYNTGYGIDHLLNFETAQGPWKVCYQTFEPFSYFKQGFSVEIKTEGKTIKKELNKNGFNNIGFIGEYPIARILYEDDNEELPVAIEMEAFSPFIPLKARESANPGTILKFKLKNTSKQLAEVNLAGHIQNMVMADLKSTAKGVTRNQKLTVDGKDALFMDFIPEDSTDKNHPYYGNMALTLLTGKGEVQTNVKGDELAKKELGQELVGSVSSKIILQPNEEKEVTFLLTWFFPNRPKEYGDGGNWNQAILTKGPIRGNMYANWYSSSLDVATYLANNIDWLSSETYRFHDSWYNKSNLPYWLKQRIMMPVSTLATETCQWWADNKFWAWEGVGSCVGVCTHVYNYEQAIARLFPELQRNIREKIDFGTSFNDDDGSITARNGAHGVWLDGHIGAVLKSLREYLLSKDKLFLSRNWKKIKMAMDYTISQDGDSNGILEGKQSNTYDISFMGPNTYVGGLYLAALKAAAEMAIEMGEDDYAQKCNKLFESGSRISVERLWNGHYFIQDVDLEKHPKNQYAHGCLSDQLFGQTWAHQLHLGYIYPKEKVKATLNSIWKYNWTMDVGPHTRKFVPERYYAHEGEPGLLNCTWPISEHLNENAVRYRNEVWTGIEYQVATNMIYNGMIKEGLSIVKAVHERYRPEKHNPWNEIECGDHYARALASWGILVALEDYFYNGPKGIMKFSPRISENEFNGFFAAAEAWGNIGQQITNNQQINSISVEHGKLYLNEIEIEHKVKGENVLVKLNNKTIESKTKIVEGKMKLSDLNLNMNVGDMITIEIKKIAKND